MQITVMCSLINQKLAGERLSEMNLLPLMDEVMIDINNQLNSTFPLFSDFKADVETNGPDFNYSLFPDKYLRTVVVYGAATKFYSIDEEGISPAEDFSGQYMKYLFMMLRDYADKVPEEYQDDAQGFITPNPLLDRGIWLL